MTKEAFLEHIPYKFPISYSQFSLYLECPKKYALQYLAAERVKQKPYPNTMLGNAMHHTLETFYNEMIYGRPITDLRQMEEILTKELWNEMRQAGDEVNMQKSISAFADRTGWERYYQSEMLQLLATGKTLLGGFFKEHFKDEGRYQPEAVELSFTCELPDAHKYPGLGGVLFTAKVDFLELDTLTEEYRVIDHKVSARFDREKLQTNPQLTFYAYLISRKLGKTISAVGYQVFDTSVKKVCKIMGKRTEEDFDGLLKDLANIVPSMKLPFHYRRPGDYCSYCQFKVPCQANKV